MRRQQQQAEPDHPDGWDPALRLIAQLRQVEASTPAQPTGLLLEPGDVVKWDGPGAARLQMMQTLNTSGVVESPLVALYGGARGTERLWPSVGSFQQNLALTGYDSPLRQQSQQQTQGIAGQQQAALRQQQLAQMQGMGTWWGGASDNTIRKALEAGMEAQGQKIRRRL